MSGEDLSKLRIDRSGEPLTRRRGRYGRYGRWLVLLAVLAAGVAGYFYLSARAAIPVEIAVVTQAYPSQAYTQLNATGYVVAQRKAAVASKATGRLEWLGVREGSIVRENEVLARLENKDVVATLQQAQANVNLSRANLQQGEAEFRDAQRALERSADLLKKNFVSAAAHDIAVARQEKANAAIVGLRASIAVAQANVRAAQVGVDQTLIRAPFDGVVLTKNANVGDVITPLSSATGSQAAVVTMADMSTLEVEADVSEASVGKVKTEQPCEIQLDALPGERFRGVVSRMVPTVDRAKATVTVKVRFVDKDVRILPEMSAKVAFLAKETPAAERAPRTVVSPASIVERAGHKVVYVVSDGKAVETPIQTGAGYGDVLEVKQGVKPGDKIVLKPPERLRDGAAVSVAAK
ncbi:MAG TPA: efflux RND transporter periplasmic adaptor subunit [Burkholderiales bacterium]|nr:efflux RND transporter periplasmic adaptor subunit [Burkholderiales bacterium]